MTSAIAPRRFSRVDVQLALQDANCPEWMAQRILERLGLGDNMTLGQQVARALDAVWQYNRPSFASDNTYGGMAWDRAHNEVGAAITVCGDMTQVWAGSTSGSPMPSRCTASRGAPISTTCG